MKYTAASVAVTLYWSELI